MPISNRLTEWHNNKYTMVLHWNHFMRTEIYNGSRATGFFLVFFFLGIFRCWTPNTTQLKWSVNWVSLRCRISILVFIYVSISNNCIVHWKWANKYSLWIWNYENLLFTIQRKLKWCEKRNNTICWIERVREAEERNATVIAEYENRWKDLMNQKQKQQQQQQHIKHWNQSSKRRIIAAKSHAFAQPWMWCIGHVLSCVVC